MGTHPGAKTYNEQQREVLRQQARTNVAVSDEPDRWAEVTADALIQLINNQPCSPSKVEIAALLLKSLEW